jgi:FKBP-type peptidyl-prolyl cis-trans isomerase FkpA
VRILTPILLSLFLAFAAAAKAPPELATDDDRAIYTYGAMLAMMLRGVDLTPAETELLLTGFRDQLGTGELALELDKQQEVVKAFVAKRTAESSAREAERSKAFLTEKAAVPGADVSETGLVFVEQKAGAGKSPVATDTVKVHYHGTLRDGTVFDSSRSRGEPAVFTLDKVIPCWQEAIPRMKEGGVAAITCPASIAYGDRGMGMKIPGGASLYFEVELITVE